MRIIYIDIDSLRPDHLGCYGYHRNTSPNIDAIDAQGVRFDNVYITDAPCLPSRTALWSGRCGFHTGVVNHGGVAGQPLVEGPQRGFEDQFLHTGWMSLLRGLGYTTATVSSFGERHSAWHWYAGFNHIINPGKRGLEDAHDVMPLALNWLNQHAASDHWFLHLNLWDPHTPYSTPLDYGNPFEDDPIPAWLTEDVWQASWKGFGPHSAQELHGFGNPQEAMWHESYPRVPAQLNSFDKVKQWIDGYDVGIHYADHHLGQLFNTLTDMGVFDETVIMISADHGENQGEFNIWGDHQTADQITCRVPLIVRWPGLTDEARTDDALHYHYDWAATLIELLGGSVPENWDGQSFASAFKQQQTKGRNFVVTSQGAWACQRGVRFNQDNQSLMYLQTYHDGYKQLDPQMLFNLSEDPHQQNNLVESKPEWMIQAQAHLNRWLFDMTMSSSFDVDPMMTVLREGGPLHTRGLLSGYLDLLTSTGRAHHAQRLKARHPGDVE